MYPNGYRDDYILNTVPEQAQWLKSSRGLIVILPANTTHKLVTLSKLWHLVDSVAPMSLS